MGGIVVYENLERPIVGGGLSQLFWPRLECGLGTFAPGGRDFDGPAPRWSHTASCGSQLCQPSGDYDEAVSCH